MLNRLYSTRDQCVAFNKPSTEVFNLQDQHVVKLLAIGPSLVCTLHHHAFDELFRQHVEYIQIYL